MSRETLTRTQDFRWNSKHDLYEYFEGEFGLDRKAIDSEVQLVMTKFRPRKGQAIRTQELWQKVGLNLETTHGRGNDGSNLRQCNAGSAQESRDYNVAINEAQNAECEWKNEGARDAIIYTNDHSADQG